MSVTSFAAMLPDQTIHTAMDNDAYEYKHAG